MMEKDFDFETDYFIFRDQDIKEGTVMIGTTRYWETFENDEEKDSFLQGLSITAYCGSIDDSEKFYILFANDEYVERRQADCEDNDEFYFAEFNKTGLVRAVGMDKESANCVLDYWCGGSCLTYKDHTPRKKRNN